MGFAGLDQLIMKIILKIGLDKSILETLIYAAAEPSKIHGRGMALFSIE